MAVFLVCVLLVSISGNSSIQYPDDSLNVRFVGQCDTPGNAYYVVVQGSYAYVADFNGGLRIIDVSNPASPFELGYCDSTNNSVHVSVEGSYAYVGGRYQSLDIINIQNPAAPYIEGVYTIPASNGIFNIEIVHPRAYCISSNYCPSPQSLRAIDISTPSNPTFIDSCLAGQGTGMHQGLVVDGDYAYVISYVVPKFLVIDISDVYNMHEVASCSLPYWFAYDMQKEDTLIYAAVLDDGILVINVADPLSPQIIEQFQTQGRAMGVHVDNNLAYVAARDSGLRVLDVTDPAQISEIGFHDTPSYAYDVFYQAPYIFVAAMTEGLCIYEFMPTSIKGAKVQKPVSLFKIKQNPVKDDFIEIGFQDNPYGEFNFMLYDACGRLCCTYSQRQMGSNRLQLDISMLQAGIYFLACSQDTQVVQIEKIVKL